MQKTAPDLQPTWFRAFRDLPREHGFERLEVEGTIPPELRGTLYRNGPSLFSNHGRGYGHWFDGDGAVSAVRFAGGRAEGAVRVVQSDALLEERRQGRALFSGYGTPVPGGPIARIRNRGKNAANTSVFSWQGKLYALFEGGRPTEIDPGDLQTLGESSLGGVLGPTFSAHPHRVRSRKASYNFGIRYGRETLLDVYELPDEGPCRRIASVQLAGPTMIHDFIATNGHLIFLAPPLRLRIVRQLLGLGTYGENLAWRPEMGTEVVVVPLANPESPIRFSTEPFYQWHFANAFERGGQLVLDLVRYPDFDTNEWLRSKLHGGADQEAQGTYWRSTIDAVARTLRSEERWAGSCEFPRVDPRVLCGEHRVVWLAAHAGDRRGMFDAVAKLRPETGSAEVLRLGDDQFPSEPIFAPRPGSTAEDDGWVLSLVYDARAHRSHVAILDGRRLADGPVARAFFDHHLPFTFHGGWMPMPA